MNALETPEVKRRRPWRLRTRLALAILVVFMPITALVMVSHIENLEDRRDSRLEALQTVGQTIAASVDGFSRDLESFSVATASAFGAADVALTQEQTGPYLQRVQQSYGNVLRSVFVTNQQGVVTASGVANAGVGTNLSDRAYVKALQSGRESVWSGAVVGSETGQTTMVHGRVIRGNDGLPRGFLLIAFYPQVLATERFPADVPEDGDVSLIDDTGAVMFSSKGPQNGPRNIANDPVFVEAKRGAPVLLRSGDSPLASEKSYGAFVPVPKTGWVVGFTRPASAIDGPLQERFFRDLLIVVASIIAGFSAMLIAASRLSRPLSRLAFAAGAIARGERPVLPTAAADAEVRELEIAMDTMSRAVIERQERLAQQARVLETLERVGEIMAELDFNKVAASITQACLELTQGDAAGIFYRPLFEEGHIELASFAGDVPAFPLLAEDDYVRATLQGEVVDEPDVTRKVSAPPIPLDAEGARLGRSLLGMPMRSRAGIVVGGLFLIREQAGAFGDYERRLALGLARRAAIALENARLYSQSRETQDELKKANLAKTEFIGMLSHELRTPLTTIYGGARLLHTRRDSLPEQDAIELIESIEEESERLRRLVENLLALARADVGEEVARDIISVGPIVDQTVKQFVNRRPGRPIEIKMERGLPLVLAEPTYVRQVLHNLITNADKYSPSGLPIDIEGCKDGDGLEIRVLDKGPGVPPDEIGQIFGSFYRSERTARTATGKGLGLTVCKRLVEAMGGQVWARPRDGGGLEVGFSLPLAEDPGDPADDTETKAEG